MALARWQRTIVDDTGAVQSAAEVEVRNEQTNALATLFSDRAGATPLANPLTADSQGFAAFYAAGGAYKITATKDAFSRVWRHEAVGTAAEHDAEFFVAQTDLDPLEADIAELQSLLLPIKPEAFDEVYAPAIRRYLRAVPDILDYSGGAVSDYTDAMLDAEEAAFNNEIRTLYFPNAFGNYTIDGPAIEIRSGLTLLGEHSSMSQIVFTNLSGGIFWTATNFAGGGIIRMGFLVDTGGGNTSNPVRIGSGNPTNAPQQFVINDCLVSGLSNSTMDYCLIVDGTSFPGDSGGVRAIVINDLKCFNSMEIAVDLRYVRSAMLTNINIFQGQGDNETLNISGLADTGGLTRTSVGVSITGLRCNDLIFDRCTDVSAAALAIETNVSISANGSNIELWGKTASFSNSGGSTCRFNGSSSSF